VCLASGIRSLVLLNAVWLIVNQSQGAAMAALLAALVCMFAM
jgi:hypothetical protein